MPYLTGRHAHLGITAACGAGFLLFGYDQGVMSGLLTGNSFNKQFPAIDTNPGTGGSASLQGTVVAIYEIGCLVGSLLAFAFGERLGRRRMIMTGCGVLILGTIIQTTSFGIPQLIAGRIVTGFGNGMNTSTIPVWHSETCGAHNRGKNLCIELAINIFGVMTAYWLDYGFSFISNQAQFRVPIAIQAVFAVVCMSLVLVLPESPRWLAKQGRTEESFATLQRLSVDGVGVAEAFEEITETLKEEQEQLPRNKKGEVISGMRACFTNGPGRYFYRVSLGVASQFMQQLCGINLITYYAPVIFERSVGLPHSISLLLAGANGTAYFFSSLVPIWLIDRVGRRKLMIFALVGQCCCMAILAGTTSVSSFAPGIVASVMLFLFNFFFSVGLLAIPWLLPAEYSPLPIRAPAAALASASNWIFTFLVVEITPVCIDSIGHNTYVMFAVLNFCFIPLVYWFYPETARLSLEQIDVLFTGDKVLLHAPKEDLERKIVVGGGGENEKLGGVAHVEEVEKREL